MSQHLLRPSDMIECPNCHQTLAEGSKFCNHCGAKLPDISAAPEPQAIEIEKAGESSFTFLCADIKGSTAMIEKADEEWAAEILKKTINIISETIQDYHGDILAYTGDGAIACFTGKNHALQACYAAAAIQKAIVTANLTTTLRLGIHSPLSSKETLNEVKQSGELQKHPDIIITQNVESACSLGGIQISQLSYHIIKPYIKIGSQKQITVPGRMLPLITYEIYDLLPSAMHQITPPKSDTSEDEEYTLKDKPLVGEKKFITSCFIKLLQRGENSVSPEKIQSIIRSSINNFDGTFVKQVGDVVYVIFGAPIAFEDHPLRACLASYILHEKIIEESLPLDVRIGINTGEAVIVKEDENKENDIELDAYGSSVNLAARMMQTAASDQIQLGKATRSLVEKYIQCLPLGEKFVKGFSEPVSSCALVGIDRDAIRRQLESQFYGGSKFYGREKELEHFNTACSSLSQRQGSGLAFKAPPGIGKTRLVYESSQIALERNIDFYSVSSSSFEKKENLSTLRQFVKNLFSFASGSKRMVLNRLQNTLRMVPFSHEYANASIITILGGKVEDEGWLGLSPILQTEVLFKSLWEYINHVSNKSPVILIFEDLHWCDGGSIEFLIYLSLHLKDSSVLLLLDYRPEFILPDEMKTSVIEHTLQPLTSEDSKKIIQNLLPGDDSLIPVREKILTTALGNPFYIEEYVKALINRGIIHSTEKAYTLSGDFSIDMMPETLKGLISSSIDQLTEEEKELLQQASILGKTFPIPVLRYISEANDIDLRKCLEGLENKGFISKVSLFPSPIYSFKHYNIWDVANHSMLQHTRISYHQRFVTNIEKDLPDELEEYYLLLAQHAFSGELWTKSIHYFNLYTPDHISIDFPNKNYYTVVGPAAKEAFDKIKSPEEQEAIFPEYSRILFLWVHSIFITGQLKEIIALTQEYTAQAKRYNEVLFQICCEAWEVIAIAESGHASEVYERAKSLIPKLDDKCFDELPPLQSELIKDGIALWVLHVFLPLGKYEEFDRIAEPIIAAKYDFSLVHFTAGVAIKAPAYMNYFWCNSLRARPQVMKEKLPYLLEQIDLLPDAEPKLLAITSVGIYHYLVGNFDKAYPYLLSTVEFAQKIEQGFVEAYTLALFGQIKYYQGDEEEAKKAAIASVSKYKEIKYVHTGFEAPFAATILAEFGQFDEALSIIDDVNNIAEPDNAMPSIAICAYSRASVLNTMAQNDRFDEEIIELLEKAQRITDKIGCNLLNPYITLTYADFYQRHGDTEKERSYQSRALTFFKEYGMTGWYDMFQQRLSMK